MRRLAHLLIPALIVASCGGSAAPAPTTSSSTTTSSTTSTTTTSSTTTTTSTTTTIPAPTTTLPPDPRFTLLFDGFEAFGRLGDDADTVITAFTEEFGDPTADSDWRDDHECSFTGRVRTVTWIDPGVRLTFGDGDSDFGTGPHLVTYTTLLPVESSWRLFGVARGMNVADLGDLFPDADVLPGGGLDYVRFDPEFPSYAWVDSSGEIRDFWGGIAYCSG